ncbi:MAG: hypothetical protein Kow00121_68000 [Elainellaceae cyanobacterium]
MTYESSLFATGTDSACLPDREIVRVVLVSSVDGVRENIHRLHILGYREATTWSRLLSTPDPNLVMSINTHYRMLRR